MESNGSIVISPSFIVVVGRRANFVGCLPQIGIQLKQEKHQYHMVLNIELDPDIVN